MKNKNVLSRKLLKQILSFIFIYAFYYPVCQADQTVVNNYSSSPASSPPPAQNCNSNSNDPGKNDVPPGMQIIQNGDGSSSRVFSTGTKKPYIVDSGCNNSPPIQPYVFPQYPNAGPPGPPGGPGPGPRGGR